MVLDTWGFDAEHTPNDGLLRQLMPQLGVIVRTASVYVYAFDYCSSLI